MRIIPRHRQFSRCSYRYSRLLPWVVACILLGGVGLDRSWSAEGNTNGRANSGDSEEKWIPLFNGRDLDDWTVKITGYEVGENFGNTFRVENGLLRVVYDAYEEFDGRFGHIFYKEPFSHYRLRVEYRFIGEQVPGGPGWAFRNSGIMFHGQTPESMTKDQQFPVSIEAQLLGGNGRDERPNMNVCTPGTHIVMNEELITRHCTSSTSPTFHGDQWVTVEVEVRGHDVIRHLVDGKVVLEYTHPQLDEGDADAQRLLKSQGVKIDRGTISLQSESHPVEFRKVELLKLEP
jgi:hypothetical protein